MHKQPRRVALSGATTLAAILAAAALLAAIGNDDERTAAPDAAAATPVLAVAMTHARPATLPRRIPATGNIVPWQEASVGTEAEGLPLIDVKVNVGDRVRRGQVLAVFKPDMVAADLAEAQATVAQARAQLTEAEANAERANALEGSGAMSAQQIDQYVLAGRTARARLDAAKAVERRHRLRLAQTRVLAPGDGVISARTATVGAVMPAGQELFRLIRDGRLEWRATVAMPDLRELAPGQAAHIGIHGQAALRGRLRIVAPSIDTGTHHGLAYVDLPAGSPARAGAFARGFFEVGEGPALTVPRQAVLLRDGFSYVMRLDPRSRVLMTKVSVGRRLGDRVEITGGLDASQPIVASGVGFLGDGDTVRVVGATEDAPARTAAAARGTP